MKDGKAKLNLDAIADDSMFGAMWITLTELNDKHELSPDDIALIKLAFDVAERIDSDGPKAGISLYGRLFWILMTLRDEPLIKGRQGIESIELG